MRLAIVNIYASFNCQHLQRKLIHRKKLKKASPDAKSRKIHLKSFVQPPPRHLSVLPKNAKSFTLGVKNLNLIENQ